MRNEDAMVGSTKCRKTENFSNARSRVRTTKFFQPSDIARSTEARYRRSSGILSN